MPDDSHIVVRGGLLEIASLRADVEAARRRFGRGGISVFGVADLEGLQALARTRLIRFDAMTLVYARSSQGLGLEIVPTFK